MDDLALQYAALSRAASTTSAVFDELTRGSQIFDGWVRSYLGTGWQGEAAAAFGDGYDEWAAGAREALAAIATMSDLIVQANQRFAAQDSSVTASMDAIATRLGGRP